MTGVKSVRSKVLAVALACVTACVIAVPVKALADVQTNYSWYKGHEADASFTLSTAGEMKALSSLVNGTADYDGDGTVDAAVSFEGKTISLSEGLPINFLGENIEPIGTAEHPFQGTFDGSARQVDNFTITIAAESAHAVTNIGLFGYVGDKGALHGVSVGPRSSLSIERDAASTDYIANVGLVAGYCGGTMSECSNAGTVTVTSSVLQQSAEQSLPVRNVGGVAGQCVYDVVNCANTGALAVSELSSPVASFEKSQLACCIGGVVGLLGDETRMGDWQTHIYSQADKHGSIDGCTNTGKLVIDTPMLSGLDRFGEQTSAESMFVGGVVGYSQGSVTNCVNGQALSSEMGSNGQDVGYIRAENGDIVGGVCGSLRGVKADNMNTAWADDGADGNDPLVMTNCVNYGDVYARVTAGGVVGKTSSYTTVAECLNLNKRDYFGNQVETYVVATRWNKPGPAGIVGTATGNVAYCANFGTIASGKWTDEATRTFMTMDGYYAAGIAGFLVYFDDQATAHGGIATPLSEVYSCYNAGSVIAGANMRQRGIVGENDGFTHDNVLVAGLVYNDEIVYGDSLDENEASGTVGENRVYEAADLRGAKAAEAVAFLNRNSQANGWQRYWILPENATKKGLNQGYPLLETQNPWAGKTTSIADAQVSLAADAQYTGGESIPSAKVVLNGTTLTENADYRVVAQTGAVAPSQGKAYAATVIGLGRYAGTANQKLAYDIVAGDFSACTITVQSHTFDYEGHVPSADEVVVRTPAGTLVEPAEYSFKLVDALGDAIEPPVNAGFYRLIATANEDSALFKGEIEGAFRIKPASFVRDVKYDDVTITHLGVAYPWVDSMEAGESDNPSTTLRYTGVAVKPVVSAITYKGHTLVEGTDYRIVYGNSNSDDGYPDDQDEYNMGKAGGSSIGCVTIRNITGRQANFSSYANMFFNIVDDGARTDLALATYEVAGTQISDGKPLEPVVLYLGKTKLTKDVDYTITYRNNVNPGTATFTATGIGGFTGSLSGEFAIEEGDTYELAYAFAGAGTSAEPYEATVTGVAYRGSRDVFSLDIPETVEHEGAVYTVTAIADSAFGGSGASDFAGSVQNESKLKLGAVSIPATVRSIGDYAFGTGSLTMSQELPLASVDIAAGSQLRSIGRYAFAKCRSLAQFTVPAQVESIGDYAFGTCNGLSELRFLATAAKLPSSVGAHAFTNCANVQVRGFAGATAVRQIARGNAGATAGTNGGKNFTFKALQSLADAQVSVASEFAYTGSAIEPAVAVTLDGARLTQDVDYAVSYADNVNAGTARVLVSGIGDRGGVVERTFQINALPIARASFSRVPDQQFSGQAVAPRAELSFNGVALTEGVDYTTSFTTVAGEAIDAPTDVGTYRLVVTGQGNFKGQTYREFRVVAASIEQAVIGAIGDKVYTGAPIEPDVTMRVGEANMVRDRDYVLSYADNVAVGQATVHVHGIGGFEGSAELHFRIVQASVEEAALAGVDDVQVDPAGKAVSFNPVVIVNGAKLAEGVDYAVSYATETGEPLADAPSTVGSYQLLVSGKGSYTGTVAAPFAVTAASPAAKTDLSSATMTLSSSAVDYGAAPCTPQVNVKRGNTTLVEGADFIVAYENNVNPGEARAVAYGIGAYAGSVEAPFTVRPVAISPADIVPVADQTYTGETIAPHLAVLVNGRSLSEGADYTVSYRNNKKAGTATATVTGTGGYTGSADATFTIAQASNAVEVAKAKVTKTYKAKAKTKKLAKAKTFALPAVSAAFGTPMWKVTKADAKKVLLLKGSKVQVKKGAKAGTYTMKLKAQVKATANYTNAVSKAVTVKVKITKK